MEAQVRKALKIANNYQKEVLNMTKFIEKIETEKKGLADMIRCYIEEIKILKESKTLYDNHIVLKDQFSNIS